MIQVRAQVVAKAPGGVSVMVFSYLIPETELWLML